MADRLEDLLRACTVRVLGGPAPGAGFFVAPGHVLTCAHVTGGDGTVQDSQTQGSPAQGSSGQGSPMRDSPIQGGTAQGNPVRDSPTQGRTAQASPVRDSPAQGGRAHGGSGPLVVRWERDGHDPVEIPVTEPVLVLPSRGRPIPALAADYPDIAILRVSGLGAHPCVLLDDGWPEPEDGFQVFGYPSEGGAVTLTPARLTYRGPHGTTPTLFFDLGSDTIKPGMSGAALLNLRTGAVCGIVTATKHPERPDGALAIPWAQIAADLADITAANQAFHDTNRRWDQARRLTASRPPGPVPPGPAPPPGADGTTPAEKPTHIDGATPARKPTHAEVIIEATLANGTLESATWLAGSCICRHSAPLPAEVAGVWSASAQPELLAGERLAVAGRRLTTALLDDDAERLLAGLITRLRPGDSAEVTFNLSGEALSLPAELLRLSARPGADTGPLALLPAVSVCRRTRGSASLDDRPALGAGPPTGTAGPLKILAAVAAPDETKTRNVPLDTEAEMQAVIDAVTTIAGGGQAQVKILEVAFLPAIRQALTHDSYHVLHLSAHGSAQMVELEDEDGAPAAVTPRDLIAALQHAGRPVPLIVLSSCSGGSSGSQAMAAALVSQGADRVIAMLTPVTDVYATTLARHLYAELAAHPQLTVGLALARARYLAEEHRSHMPPGERPPPEYCTPTLLVASGDGPLIDPALPPEPLVAPTTPPSGTGVRALPMGALIGRRQQLRDAMAALRRTPAAVEKVGAASGVVLTGVGGIGKTALAGRIISRLHDDGWLIAVHEGRWNPTALIATVTQAIAQAQARAADQLGTQGGELDTAQAAEQPGARGELGAALAFLSSPDIDDVPKLAAIAALLASAQLLVVLDDFEQNLTTGGGAFLDPAIADAITTLADNAATGALLVTSRCPARTSSSPRSPSPRCLQPSCAACSCGCPHYATSAPPTGDLSLSPSAGIPG